MRLEDGGLALSLGLRNQIIDHEWRDAKRVREKSATIRTDGQMMFALSSNRSISSWGTQVQKVNAPGRIFPWWIA